MHILEITRTISISKCILESRTNIVDLCVSIYYFFLFYKPDSVDVFLELDCGLNPDICSFVHTAAAAALIIRTMEKRGDKRSSRQNGTKLKN